MQVDCIHTHAPSSHAHTHTHEHVNVRTHTYTRTHIHARTSTHRAFKGHSALLKETYAIISGGMEDLTGNPLVV